MLFSPNIYSNQFALLVEGTPLKVSSYLEPRPNASITFFGPMSSTALIRFAARTQPSCLFTSSQPARRFSPLRELYAGSSAPATCSNFSTSVRRAADKDGEGAAPGHGEETFQEFTARYANTPRWPTILLIHSETFGLRYLQRVNWLMEARTDTRRSSTVSKTFLSYRYTLDPHRPVRIDIKKSPDISLPMKSATSITHSPTISSHLLRSLLQL